VTEDWVAELTGPRSADAQRRLYALLLKAADFEVRRRAPISGLTDVEDLVTQSADDALLAIMRKLHTYRGESRFTTWAYKFALYEAAAKTRRRAWRDRELPLLTADFPGRPTSDDLETAELLRAVARVDGIERVRFTSPYPVDFTAAVIAAIAEEPKISKYVHLPVQSGSDIVLERMRRGYTVADYRAIVARLRAAMPDIALSTDILTGFSGETDEDHAQTLELMREIRFDSAFMFAYSERDLTFAAKKLPDDVPPEVK
jgi:DNA-directed RNA polymerase specialized sigma24 family protein